MNVTPSSVSSVRATTTSPAVPAGTPVVGIVGGGQLARMLVHAAQRLGVQTRILAAPGAAEAVEHHGPVDTGDPLDPKVLDEFCRSCDAVTLENESIDAEVVEALARLGRPVRPGAGALRLTDKARQRTTLATLGFPVPPHAICTSVREITDFAARHGWPVVAKQPRGGYDGRGVHWLESDEQAMVALAVAGPGGRLLVEPALRIERELAVLVARRADGEHVVYPVVDTVQRNGICHSTIAPSVLDPALLAEATTIAVQIAHTVDAVGVFAVELFVVDGHIVVNEVAPRPHNSGHFTIDGCVTSQFENHLRAVLGWPLGSTALRAGAVAMVNVLGGPGDHDPRANLPLALADPDVHVHLYGKQAKAGRKLGHVTALAPGHAEATDRAVAAAHALVHGHRSPGTAE